MKSRYKFQARCFGASPFIFNLLDSKKVKIASSMLCVINLNSPENIYMIWIDTRKKYQGKGLASQLLQKIQKERLTLKNGTDFIVFKTEKIITGWGDSTEAGRKLCLKNGFKRDGDSLVWNVKSNGVNPDCDFPKEKVEK